uniref:protein-tyrosine-phosphatase n=1 Tax=Ditylenchus dipsaci TaxID=166011 RepID=A0A915DDL1_9BILA
MSLLILPLLSLLAAQGTTANSGSNQPVELRALNGTQLILKCPPAEFLVRNHMAPDFENPQLVRRLDWFHDNALVASYQQEVVSDISQQWWVSSTRYELRKPFYELGLSPLLPQDSGVTFSLVVLVKPLAPSKPQVTSYTDKSVTLGWSQSAGAAHRPILRYSILISQVDDNNLRVLTTDDNRTHAVVSQLLPNTQYVFSVRAENSAGESGFGPETVFKTIGQAPSVGPQIVSLANGTTGCIDVEWKLPEESTDQTIVGYRIMVHRIGTGAMREWYVKGHKQSLCSLEFFTDYITQQAAPEGPPEHIVVKPLSATTITVSWRQPSTPNGPILSYQIYYKEHKSQKQHPTLIRLLVEPGELSKTFAYNLTKLVPLTTYKFRLSASTMVGESDKSAPQQVTTDRDAPSPPQLLHISHGGGACTAATVHVEWSTASKGDAEKGKLQYRLMLESANKKTMHLNTTLNRILVNHLEPSTQYFVEVRALVPSLYNNNTYLESGPSRRETFIIYKDKCQLHSSICLVSTANCQSLALPAMDSTNPSTYNQLSSQYTSTSFVILLAGVIMTIVLSMFFTWFLKSQCILFKEFLRKAEKKKDLKTNHHHVQNHSHPQHPQHQEIISLVNDPLEMVFGQTVTIHQFDDYCNQLAENSNDGYRIQFQELELETNEEVFDSMTSEEESLDENNRLKNRYMNIGAVEHTRIRIFSGTSADGYINANYIDSCDDKNAYIATQAPLPHTFSDFWTMVWQEKCNVIVVITNLVESGRRKCDQYWPSTPNTTMDFDNFQLTLNSEEHNSVFVHRIITLKSHICNPAGTSERIIHQLHFTSWPDHGVPDTVFPLLYFLNYVSEINSTGPIVVHCSAGVGRSGSFILIDSMRRHLLQCDRINIQAHLRHIRRQRARLVQTLDQYMFCHEVLRQLIRHGVTRQPVLDFPNYLDFLFSQLNLGGDGRSRLQLQYEDLCRCIHDPRCVRSTGCIVLPGYHRADEFLVCSWPAECPDLWITLWDHQCQTIVLLGSDAEVSDYFRLDHQTGGLITSNGNAMTTSSNTSNADLWLSATPKIVHIEDSTDPSHESDGIGRRRSIHVSHHSKDHMLLRMAMKRPRGGPTSSLPYILCALQSAACQLETERYVDVCLFLASYRHLACGCWSSQSNVEYIYTKVLELIQMQRRPAI